MSNGKLALSTLTKIGAGQYLRNDAAAAFVRLSAEFQKVFGTPLGVTDSYRSYAAQVDVKRRKGKFAATPGTSNHGWGIALDLASRVNLAGSAEHRWMQNNAGRYGWINPAWARDNNPANGQQEPWHWEFVPGMVQSEPAVVVKPTTKKVEKEDEMLLIRNIKSGAVVLLSGGKVAQVLGNGDYDSLLGAGVKMSNVSPEGFAIFQSTFK